MVILNRMGYTIGVRLGFDPAYICADKHCARRGRGRNSKLVVYSGSFGICNSTQNASLIEMEIRGDLT